MRKGVGTQVNAETAAQPMQEQIANDTVPLNPASGTVSIENSEKTASSKKAKPKIVDVAVLLDPDNALRAMINTDSDIDMVIEPKDARQMIRFLGGLAKKGKQVGRLILAGHGYFEGHHIGSMVPRDVDIEAVRNDQKEAYLKKRKAEKQVQEAQKLLGSAKDEKSRQELEEKLKTAQKEIEQQNHAYENFREIEKELVDAEDAMAEGGVIGLINCFAASDEEGKKFMNQIAESLLAKNGGRIIGCTGGVIVKTPDSLWEGFAYWLRHGEWRMADDPVIHKNSIFDSWETIEKPKTNKTRHRCGAPCKDFERYGFCDNPVKDEGTCHLH